MKVRAKDTPRSQVLVDLIQRHRWSCGAELGVEAGYTHLSLLEACPVLRLVGVDTWAGKCKKGNRDALYGQLGTAVRRFGGRSLLVRARTVEAPKFFRPAAFDFVFIDADHSEDAVRADIRAWAPLIKPNGWLTGHDYDLPGVAAALEAELPTARRYSKGSQVWGAPVLEWSA